MGLLVDNLKWICCGIFTVGGLFIVTGGLSDKLPLIMVGMVVCIVAMVGFFVNGCYLERSEDRKKHRTFNDLSVVGFNRQTVERVCALVKSKAEGVNVYESLLRCNEDFNPDEIKTRVLLVASYSERNNILGQAPDYGELSIIFKKAHQPNLDNVCVMYAGVPQMSATWAAGRDELYPDSYKRLTMFQPDLQTLMNKNRFLVVSNIYDMSEYQTMHFTNWLEKVTV